MLGFHLYLSRSAIEHHLDSNIELEMALRAKGQRVEAKVIRNILPEGIDCVFVRQPEQLGWVTPYCTLSEWLGKNRLQFCWRMIS